MCRNESTLAKNLRGRNNLTIIKGDVLVPEDVSKALEGADSVVVVLGTRNSLEATTLISKGTENIIEAMKAQGLRKISVCNSAFQFRKFDDIPGIFREHSKDHQRQLDLVKGSAGLEWRLVLPPHISDEPSSTYQVVHDRTPGRSISKHDLGAFLVDCLEAPEHKNAVIGLATTKTTALIMAYRIFNTIKAIPIFARIFWRYKFGSQAAIKAD